MKKDKLIALLNRLEGNPDIYLWNGVAEDWVDIEDVPKITLVKEKFKKYLDHVRMESFKKRKEFDANFDDDSYIQCVIKPMYTKYVKWTIDPYLVADSDYHKKTVGIMLSKEKGETSFDRCGTLTY